jgi:ribosomal protein L13E
MQHEEIAAVAESVAPTPLAIYQTAVDVPGTPNEQTWEAARGILVGELQRRRPAAIGLNLVQPATDPSVDLPLLVERAATLLLGC